MTDTTQPTLQDQLTDPSQTGVGPKPPEPAKQEPTPAPTPATEPTPEPAKEPAKDTPAPDVEPEPAPTEFTKYGDPEADAIVEFVQEAGMTPADAQEVFGKSVESGKLEDIDAVKLAAKLGENKAKVVLAAVKTYFDRVQSQITDVKNAVYGVVGGEDNMKLIGEWARTKEVSDPAFKQKVDTYRNMLKQGKVEAELAAKELKALYNSDPNNKTLGTKQVTGDNPGQTNFEPITKRQYFTEMEVAVRTKDKAKIEQLNARRLASKAKGY